MVVKLDRRVVESESKPLEDILVERSDMIYTQPHNLGDSLTQQSLLLHLIRREYLHLRIDVLRPLKVNTKVILVFKLLINLLAE